MDHFSFSLAEATDEQLLVEISSRFPTHISDWTRQVFDEWNQKEEQMTKSLVHGFEVELTCLIEKYSEMEMTVAEAIGVLEVKKHDILMAGFGEEEE